MTAKSFLQRTLETVVDYYSEEAILKAIDFVGGLDESDLKAVTKNLSPDEASRVYRVWNACRPGSLSENPHLPQAV